MSLTDTVFFAAGKETNAGGNFVLEQILENKKIASENKKIYRSKKTEILKIFLNFLRIFFFG